MILPGVSIGDAAVVGAGAVVSRDVKSRDIVVGNPARVVGHRDCDVAYRLGYFPLFDTDVVL